jgi:catecholate siderophore receptor
MRIKIKENKRAWRCRSKYWIAMGTLAACATSVAPQKGLAQTQSGARQPEASQGLVVRRFDIPASLLGEALAAFTVATQVRVTNLSGFEGLQSPGVTGLYTPDEALKKLLAGTGLVARFQSPREAALQPEGGKYSVDVTGEASPIASSMPKYNAPLRDTAQTISVVPQEVLAEQGVTTLRDALRNVAGISLAAGEGGAQGDNLTIRGFTARNDLFIDGMRDFGSYYRDPFNLEEVEVLQGPSSVTFGRGSTGGVVNQASKAPMLSQSISGSISAGTDLTRRLTLDVNEQLGATSAFRLNLMGDENNVAGRDIAENRRFGIAPSLAFGLGSATRWTFSYLHQTADDNPDYGIPWLFNQPAPVNRNNYYGFKNGNFLRTYDDIATAKVEHDFNKHFTLRDQIRYANYVRDVQITEPQVINPALSTPLSQLQINRNQITANSVETNLDEQLDLISRFKTGFIKHTVTTGVEAGKETSDPRRTTWNGVPTTSLLNPDETQAFSGIPTTSSNVHTTALTAAAYVLDTMELGKHWDLTGGFRWDRFDTAYTQSVSPASAFNRLDQLPTWRSALVYKPVAAGSMYVAAGTSFNPSAESLSLSAANANLPPEKNLTYEAGTKWDLPRRLLSLRTAVFETNKTNAREPDPTNSLLNVLAGNQRVRGAEVEVRGHLTSRWDILSSYAYLDGTVVSSNYYPASVGAQLANVPRNTANLWTEYRLPHNWAEIGVGTNFVDARTASSTVPLDPTTGLVKEVPSYWVFNAMVKRKLNEHLDLQINVNNVANRYYYDELHPAHIVLGPGRSALIGLKFRF